MIYKDVMRTITGVTAGDGSREEELAAIEDDDVVEQGE